MKRENGIIGSHDYRAMKRFLKRAGYGKNSTVLKGRARSHFTPHQKAALSRMLKNYARKEGLPFEREGNVIKIGYAEGVVHNGVIDEIVISGTREECLEMLRTLRGVDRNALYKITMDNPSFYPLLNDGIGYIKPNNLKTLKSFIRGMMSKYKNNSFIDYERTQHKKGEKTIFYIVKTTRI